MEWLEFYMELFNCSAPEDSVLRRAGKRVMRGFSWKTIREINNDTSKNRFQMLENKRETTTRTR